MYNHWCVGILLLYSWQHAIKSCNRTLVDHGVIDADEVVSTCNLEFKNVSGIKTFWWQYIKFRQIIGTC